ncbi:protein ABIL2 [Citrus clementina]|uniref:protein ABIL2 n=2 Tax=Citrus TaxID=2706 RepID=UPI000CED3EF9|nr:protein ABIL2 [Citrus x clementina]
MASTSSFCDLQKASNHDELFMQQSLIFSDTLKDLKNLRKQLCSAADFFEVSYMKQNQKQIVVETLKDYAIKALINTVDHLGSVAFKVNNLLDEKIGEVSETELQFTCLEQRVKSYQDFINQAGLCQQSSIILTPKHHKRYIFPDEETTDDFGQPTSRYHSSSLSAEEECCSQFRSVAQATTMESPSLYVREMLSTLQSPQQFSRQGNLSFIRNSNNRKPENERRAASPLHFSLTRLGSLLKRSPSPSNSSANRRYPSEPRRSVSLSTNAEKDRSKEFEQYSSKSKRLFKALLSMRNPRKDSALYKFLDEN